jgi:hypothetical protein
VSPELIVVEHRRNESGLKRRESGLKLLVTKDNPNGSEILKKITGSEIGTTKQITAKIH